MLQKKKNEKGNKGRRKLSLAISHRTQKWSRGASETNHGGGFNQRHNLERGTCFPHCDSREEAWEKSHSSLLKKRVKTRGQDAVWTTTLQYRLLRCSVTATLQHDCHVAAWLPGFISDAHLSSVLLFYKVSCVLQSWTQVMRSSDFCFRSHGDSRGPLQSPALSFVLVSRITEEASGGHSFLRQGRLAGPAWALSVLSFSGCLEIVLISQRSLNSGEPH